MRAELDVEHLAVAPGATAAVGIEVYNAADVIDGVSARVIGLDPSWVRSSPSQLALFPDSSGTIALELDVPPEFPAGDHELSIELSSSVDPSGITYVPLSLSVATADVVELALRPALARGSKRAEYEVITENVGNVPVELVLTGSDNDRLLSFAFEPSIVVVPPSSVVVAGLTVTGRRRLFGTPLARPIEVVASGRDQELRTRGTFEHAAVVPGGMATVLILAGIVALWALVFLFGLGAVLGDDPQQKAAPASLFATSPEILEASGGPGGDGPGGTGGAGTAKVDAAAVGGSMVGTVTAESTQEGVGRIGVEAIRLTRTGPELVSATATGDDGTFTLERLIPGRYNLRFSAPGFEELWYPAAPTEAGAEEIRVGALEELEGFEATVAGFPGSVAGVVDTGDPLAPAATTIVVRPVVGGVPGEPVGGTVTGPDGGYSVAGLATPGSYELTFTAAGFQPTTTVVQLGGGEALVANPARLSAGPGSISGLVTDGTTPLGGVTVRATSGAIELESATPTTGSVGGFSLTGLATPGTYLLTFSRDGFGIETIAVELGPGQDLTGLTVTLAAGTGSIGGTVTAVDGTPLGDVEVIVNGGGSRATATTLTAGAVGSYTISGLATPGTYSVTFNRAGFASQTVGVELAADGAARGVNAVLAPDLAIARGVVRGDGGAPLAGASVVVTDGATPRAATTASQPPGQWVVTALPAGSYAVTVTADGYRSSTRLIEVAPGQDLTVPDIQLTR